MKKNNIYLATKLYSLFDRKTSVVMYNSVLNSKKLSDDNIYLPFKDSNMKISTIGNVFKNIFEFDLKLGIASPQKGSHFIFLILIFTKINYRVILNISYHLLRIKLLIYLNINI